MDSKDFNWPRLGSGVGLRSEHYPDVISQWPEMDWFEAITENYMDSGGRPLHILERVRSHYPVGLHGVCLSIGSADPLDFEYLKRLKNLVRRIDPAIVSDHLCWTGVKNHQLYDLLPLPFTDQALAHVAARVDQVQSFLKRRILIENVSSYVTYKHSTMPEWEFLSQLSRRTGCGILLDLNNVYVNAFNHHFDAYQFIQSLPAAAIGQFHLAGHTQRGDYLFDTHSAPVIDEVWKLYEEALRLFGPVTTLIEWDAEIPSFDRLAEEAQTARRLMQITKERPRHKEAEPMEVKTENLQAGDLAGIQSKMLSCIIPDRTRAEEEAAAAMLLPEGEKVEGRLEAYQGGYLARHEEALAECYAAVQHVIGHETFHEWVSAYAAKHVSSHPNLNYVAEDFVEFLEAQRGQLSDWPFLIELASLERKIMRAFHAFEKAPIPSEMIAQIPPDDWGLAQLSFQSGLQIQRSDWPILDIWRARKTPVEEISIPLENRGQSILIYRNGVEVFCEPIDSLEYDMLQSLMNGKSLGETLEPLSDRITDPAQLSACFSSWNAKGIIAGIKIQPGSASLQLP